MTSSDTQSSPCPISVQLYTLRDAAARDFEGVLRRLGSIGFVGVELAGLHGMTTVRFNEVIADAGLVVSSGHLGDVSPDAFRASLDDLQAVGGATAVLAFLPPTELADLDGISRNAEAINGAAAIAAERGMTLGYHNHWWEFETVIDGRTAWSHLFDRLDPAVIAELDMYWATVGGADPRQVIADLDGRVRLLHVKDGPATDPKLAMVAVGDGSLDIPGVLTAAPSVAWHIVELDRCDTDLFDAVEASYGYLVGNGLSTGRA